MGRGLPSLDSGLPEILRNTEPDVVAFQTSVPNQNRISQSALAKQMQLVFTGSEINRREAPRRDLAIGSHGEGGKDEWALTLAVYHSASPSSCSSVITSCSISRNLTRSTTPLGL